MAAPKSKPAVKPGKKKEKRISITANAETAIQRFLALHALHSIKGYWVVPHSKLMWFDDRVKRCVRVIPTFNWDHDEPTNDHCGEHRIIRAFFR